jgi:hypothetical protein
MPQLKKNKKTSAKKKALNQNIMAKNQAFTKKQHTSTSTTKIKLQPDMLSPVKTNLSTKKTEPSFSLNITKPTKKQHTSITKIKSQLDILSSSPVKQNPSTKTTDVPYFLPKITKPTKTTKINSLSLTHLDDNSIFLSGHCTKCTSESETQDQDPDTLKLRANLAKELKDDRILFDGYELKHADAENTLQLFVKNVALNSCVYFLVENNTKNKLIIEETPYNLLCVINYINNLIENNKPLVSPFKNKQPIFGFEIDIAVPCQILNKSHTRASLIELLKKKTKLSIPKLKQMRKADLCAAASEISIKSVVDAYKKEYKELVDAPDPTTRAEILKQHNFMQKIWRVADSLGIEHAEYHPNKVIQENNNLLVEKVLQALEKEFDKSSLKKKLWKGAVIVSAAILTAVALNLVAKHWRHESQKAFIARNAAEAAKLENEPENVNAREIYNSKQAAAEMAARKNQQEILEDLKKIRESHGLPPLPNL